MNYENNLFKRFISKSVQTNPTKKAYSSRSTDYIKFDNMYTNKFSYKNKNLKNIKPFQTTKKITKYLSIESTEERKRKELNKTIAIKKLKINNSENIFPNICQYYRNAKIFDILNIPNTRDNSKRKIENSYDNPVKPLLYYYKLLKLYRFKEKLLNKSKDKNEKIKKYIIKNSISRINKLINKDLCKSDYKIINLKFKKREHLLNKEKESEEDNDKNEQSLDNLIKNDNNIKEKQIYNFFNKEHEEKKLRIISFNRLFRDKDISKQKRKEKNNLKNKGKSLNYRHIYFHNKILNNNLKK